MFNKIIIFTLLMIGFEGFVENKIVSIPIEIFKEFKCVFYLTIGLYYCMNYLLNKFKTTFKNINPEHKKMYVIKNYIKSFFLAGLCLNLNKFNTILNGNLDLIFIKRCAIYYVMNDIIGLLIVKKLPLTTKLHHITTSLCGLAIVMKEKNNIDIITLIVLYAVFSSMAFCVNFYLGHRVYSTNTTFKYILSFSSFWIYLLSCFVCWIFQLYIAYFVIPSVPYWHTILYLTFLFFVVRDDIILMKWLYNDNMNYKNSLNNK